MKKALFAILFMLPALAWAKPKPADYTLTVHVQSSRLVQECSDWGLGRTACGRSLYLNVVIDGKKYELYGGGDDYLLRLGDYKAKLLPDDSSTSDNPPPAYEYRPSYEFLFPDGKTRKFSVVSESE